MKTETTSKKRLVVSHKHAKPYRKRHYLLLISMVVAAFGLFGLVISTRIHIGDGGIAARDFISTTFNKPPTTQQSVVSSYGFSFQFDPRHLYASAIDGTSGKLYIGYELANERPYQSIKLSTKLVPQIANEPDTISVDYYPAVASKSLAAAEQRYVAVAQNGGVTPTSISSNQVIYHGLTFQKTVWNVAADTALTSQLSSHFVSYTTIINGSPLILRTNNRLGSNAKTTDIDSVAQSVYTGKISTSYQPPSPAVSAKLATNRSLLSSLLFSAASADTTLDTQTVSALYAPAVVKIYNAYCTDVSVKGQPYLTNVCSATSGSGFFISSDGYLATNGHVATENPKDLVVQNAYAAATSGNGKPLVYLAQAAGLSLDSLNTIKDDATLLDTIFNAVYTMPDSDFAKTNNVQNLLVGLDSKDPDVDQLLTLTNARKVYAPNDDIVSAKLVAADYRAADGVTKYRDSDVAILKLAGSNYPIVTLGNIAEVSQGSSLSILGYPAAASNNGLVAADESVVTLTTGKVSAIKNANGDTHRLLETEATIGHGNSGGPAIDDSGHVVGIATYTIDGGGQGDGTFNYVRDIQDLKNLVMASNLHLNTASKTQQVWQQAITAFNSAHYTKSLSYFNQVTSLYPDHPTVGDFEDRAQLNIKEGKDVKDVPVVLLIGGAIAALLLAALAIVLIVRHHGKHQLYKLATGQSALPINPVTGFGQPVQAHQLHH